METAGAAGGGETGGRGAGRSHAEAEMVAEAGGSGGRPVKLCVTNVYNSSSSDVVSLETTDTIADLKRVLQETVSGRPMPHQQRLIFRGKQCDESEQLGQVLRGLDISGQHKIHLIVAPTAEKKSASESESESGSSATIERAGAAQSLPSSHQDPPNPRPPLPAAPPAGCSQPAAPAAGTNGRPERIHLSQMQLGQLQWQYQQALSESEKALEEHRQRFNFLSAQSRALTQQQHYLQRRASLATYHLYPTPAQPSQQQQRPQIPQQQPLQDPLRVATRAATRALGGNMPGPAGGGAVRDVTGPPPEGHIPAAGLGDDGDAGRGNLVDPPPNAPDIAREARGWFKMVLQCMGVILVFGIDADLFVLALLALGGVVAILCRTGVLKEMLGSRREGGGLWQKLCTGATVITEGDGRLMDARYLTSAFFFSLFPQWKPVRSPEAIAAEAAAAEAQAAAERRARRVQAEQRLAQAAQLVDQAEQALQDATTTQA
ncbi:unnamed protein product, partial [Hapterophycus canaliculatus]